MSASKPPFGGGDEAARREYLLGLLTEKLIPKPTPSKSDGLTMGGRETLGLIRKMASKSGDLNVAGLAMVLATELREALAELECKRLIHPGDWARWDTKIKLMTH